MRLFIKRKTALGLGLALLAVLAACVVLGARVVCRVDLSRIPLYTLGGKLQYFQADHGRVPQTLDELLAKDGPGPYARPADLLDSWGAPFYYRVLDSKDSALIFTLGRDGLPGGRGADADRHVQIHRQEFR